MALYPKILALVSILLLSAMAFAPLVMHHGGGWNVWDYDSLFTMVWLGAVFFYFLLVKKPGWKRPVLSLVVMLGVTSVGPLSPAQLTRQDRQDALKQDLIEFGLLKNGRLVKVSPQPDAKTQNRIYWDFRQMAYEYGLKPLRDWLPEELRGLNWDKENSLSHLPQLMDWFGLDPVKYFPNNPYSGRTYYHAWKTSLIGDIAGYDWQQNFGFNQFNQGANPKRPGNQNATGYVLEFPIQSQYLLVEYGNQTLGKIPVGTLADRLVKYNYNDVIRNRVLPKDMVLEFSNDKVKVRLVFSDVSAIRVGQELQIKSGSGVLLARRR